MLPVTFRYTNHRGKKSTRLCLPIRIWFGCTAWHREAQPLCEMFDLESQSVKDFAMSGMLGPWTVVPREQVLQMVANFLGHPVQEVINPGPVPTDAEVLEAMKRDKGQLRRYFDQAPTSPRIGRLMTDPYHNLRAIAQQLADQWKEDTLILPAGRMIRSESTGKTSIAQLPCVVLRSQSNEDDATCAVEVVHPKGCSTGTCGI